MRNVHSYLKAVGIIALAVTIGSYTYFKAINLIEGPVITIENPKNGETLHSPLVTIEGASHNVAFITLNDRQIFTDESGHINEQLLLPYGYTILSIKAKDKLGRETAERIELVYQ